MCRVTATGVSSYKTDACPWVREVRESFYGAFCPSQATLQVRVANQAYQRLCQKPVSTRIKLLQSLISCASEPGSL